MKQFKESKLREKLKKKKNNDKQRNILKKIIMFLALICIILVFIFVINKARILRVEIIGLNRLNAMDIMEEAELSKYNNISMFNIPKEEIKADVEKNIRLKVDSIKAAFPDLLIINVEERDTLFLLESSSGIYEITDDGYVIRNETIYQYQAC